jgi:hypothetical protein
MQVTRTSTTTSVAISASLPPTPTVATYQFSYVNGNWVITAVSVESYNAATPS